MQACCNWCNAILKVADTYDRTKQRAYCNVHCLQKDYLFMRWQNDEWLNYVAQKHKGGKDGQGEDK